MLVQARLHRPHLHRVPALPGLRQRILRETVGMHVSVRVCIYLTAMRVQWSNRKKGFSLTDSNKSERNHSSSFCSCEPGFGGKLCNRPINAANPANIRQQPIRASKYVYEIRRLASRSAIGDFTPSVLNVNFSSGGEGIIARGGGGKSGGSGRGEPPR